MGPRRRSLGATATARTGTLLVSLSLLPSSFLVGAAPLSESLTTSTLASYSLAARTALQGVDTTPRDRYYAVKLLQDMQVMDHGGYGLACSFLERDMPSTSSLADAYFSLAAAKEFSCEPPLQLPPQAKAAITSALSKADKKKKTKGNNTSSSSGALEALAHGGVAAVLGGMAQADDIIERLAGLVEKDGSVPLPAGQEGTGLQLASMAATALLQLSEQATEKGKGVAKEAAKRLGQNVSLDALLLAPVNALLGRDDPISLKAKALKAIAGALLDSRAAPSIPTMFEVFDGLKYVAMYERSPMAISLTPTVVELSSSSDGGAVVSMSVLNLFGKHVELSSPPTLVGMSLAMASAAAGKDKDKDKDKGVLGEEQKGAVLRRIGDGLWELPVPEGLDPGSYYVEVGLNRKAVDTGDGKPPKEQRARLLLTLSTSGAISEATVAVSHSRNPDSGDSYSTPLMAGVVHANANDAQLLHISWLLQMAAPGAKLLPHQHFVRLTHLDTGLDTFFVAKPKAGQAGAFVVSIPLLDEASTFLSRSGEYSITILAGDASLSNGAAELSAGEITLKFPDVEEASFALYERPLLHDSDVALLALPEKHHTFRQADSRPPTAVSRLFTIVMLVPLAVFVWTVKSLKANVDGLPEAGSLARSMCWAFQGLLGAFLLLFVWYWVNLTMITTLTYAVPLSVLTVMVGRQALIGLVESREGATADTKY